MGNVGGGDVIGAAVGSPGMTVGAGDGSGVGTGKGRNVGAGIGIDVGAGVADNARGLTASSTSRRGSMAG